MKKVLTLLLIVSAFILSSCNFASGAHAASTVKNTTLGIKVSLGEKKTKIDKDLGSSGQLKDNNLYDFPGSLYEYPGSGIAVDYNDKGKAELIIIYSDSWLAIDDITSGVSKDLIVQQYGNLSDEEKQMKLITFDKNSKFVSISKKAETLLIMTFENEKIDTVMITKWGYIEKV